MIFARLYKWYALSFFKEKYQITPLELTSIRKNFQRFDWRNTHQKYLLVILSVLAERGASTISEIVENDSLSQEKKRKESRHKIYFRIIEGSKDGKVRGLLNHQILHVSEKVVASKPIKKYELSYYGIFLAIRIFTREKYSLTKFMDKITRKKYDEYVNEFVKNNMKFLNNLAKSYEHFLPLIFGKWEYLKKEFPEGINNLVQFSEDGYYEQDVLEYDDPFMNSTIVEDIYPDGSSFHFFPEHFDWSQGNFYQEEITMWFYTLMLRGNNEYSFQESLKKDEQVFSWFNEHTQRVIKRQKELLSNSQNIHSWLRKEKPDRISYLLEIALNEMSSSYWIDKSKLDGLKKDILKIESEIDKITVREGGTGTILDMDKYRKLIDQIEPLRMKLRDKTRRSLIKTMKNKWNLSRNLIIEYLTELHYILESEHSEKLFRMTLGGGEKPGWGDISIRQVPPEELRRWIRRYNWDVI